MTIVASSWSFANHPSSAFDVEFIDCGTDIVYIEPLPIRTMYAATHPVIEGFDWIYSYNSPRFVGDDQNETGKIGYMYMDMDLYTTLETYSLFEIIDDGIGINDFSFVVVYDATMDVVENKDLPISEWPFAEKHHQLYKGTQFRWNLGYNPSNVTFFGTPQSH